MPWVKMEPEKTYLDHREEGCRAAAERLRTLARSIIMEAGRTLEREDPVDTDLVWAASNLLGSAAVYADIEEKRALSERLDFYKRRRGCIPMYADDPVQTTQPAQPAQPSDSSLHPSIAGG